MTPKRLFSFRECSRIRVGFWLPVFGCLLSFFIASGMHEKGEYFFVSPADNPRFLDGPMAGTTEGSDSVNRSSESTRNLSTRKAQVESEKDIAKVDTLVSLSTIPDYRKTGARRGTLAYAEYQRHTSLGEGARDIGDFIDVDSEQVASLIPTGTDNWHDPGEPIDVHGQLDDYGIEEIQDVGLFLDVDAGHAYVTEATGAAPWHDIGDFIDADADAAAWDAGETDRVEIGRFVDADLSVRGSAASPFLRELW